MVDEHDDDDFLAYWSTRTRSTTRILGVEVVVPSPDTVPVSFDALMVRFQDTATVNEAAMEELLAKLFGVAVFAQWKDAGITGGMLKVLLAWGMWNGAGKAVSFAEAAELVDEAEAKSSGKGPNRASRRASSRAGGSAGTGRSSKPTSRASTTSTKRRSPS